MATTRRGVDVLNARYPRRMISLVVFGTEGLQREGISDQAKWYHEVGGNEVHHPARVRDQARIAQPSLPKKQPLGSTRAFRFCVAISKKERSQNLITVFIGWGCESPNNLT